MNSKISLLLLLTHV